VPTSLPSSVTFAGQGTRGEGETDTEFVAIDQKGGREGRKIALVVERGCEREQDKTSLLPCLLQERRREGVNAHVDVTVTIGSKRHITLDGTPRGKKRKKGKKFLNTALDTPSAELKRN